jgi:hypothetical protein
VLRLLQHIEIQSKAGQRLKLHAKASCNLRVMSSWGSGFPPPQTLEQSGHTCGQSNPQRQLILHTCSLTSILASPKSRTDSLSHTHCVGNRSQKLGRGRSPPGKQEPPPTSRTSEPIHPGFQDHTKSKKTAEQLYSSNCVTSAHNSSVHLCCAAHHSRKPTKYSIRLAESASSGHRRHSYRDSSDGICYCC